jgi:hypothetical protein
VSRRTRSTCKDRSSAATISRFAVAVSCFGFAVGTPVTAAQSKARPRTPQGDAELMAKEQVLGFKSARRLEEVDDEFASECRIANIVRDHAMNST